MGGIRAGHTATLMPSGLVLIAGGAVGNGSTILNSATLYNPVDGGFSALPPMNGARVNHVAVLLPDGRLLVAGGLSDISGSTRKSVEIFDPTLGDAGMWIPSGDMLTPRASFAGFWLPELQRVLFVGNWVSFEDAQLTELYDPDAGFGVDAGYLMTSVMGEPVVRWTSDRIIAPFSLSQGEMFDPAALLWEPIAGPNEDHAYGFSALLSTGQVFVTCGMSEETTLFDGATWNPTHSSPQQRLAPIGGALPSGDVLVVSGYATADDGGPNDYSPMTTAQLFLADSGTWTDAGTTKYAHLGGTVTPLPGGILLICGGDSPPGLMPVSSDACEIYAE
jgi:hypothetical protein